MKLIDLIELLFKPAPVQFEPCPWHGPVPARWLHASWTDRVWGEPWIVVRPIRTPRFMFQYSDRSVEWVSVARVVRP